MSGFGIQKRGTGRAVKKMSLGGALAIKSKAYQGKPGTYEQTYYTQALFPQATQTGYTPPPEVEKENKEEKEGMARGGDVQPPKTKKYFRPTKSGAGMTKAGVERYRRENPGSKLSTAVTGKVKPGSRSAKRRKSFCARSAGQMKMFPNAAKDPNSRLRQARRRWKC
jgi:hypothetical protein